MVNAGSRYGFILTDRVHRSDQGGYYETIVYVFPSGMCITGLLARMKKRKDKKRTKKGPRIAAIL